jgi:hypothetical protein
MEIKHLTLGQKKGLLDMLSNQKSKMTPNERKIYNLLRDDLSENLSGDAFGFKRCGNYVKMINMDTFGDRYNNCWIKIYSDNNGEYFKSKYLGRRVRI